MPLGFPRHAKNRGSAPLGTGAGITTSYAGSSIRSSGSSRMHPFLDEAHEWLGLADVDEQVKLSREVMTSLFEENLPEVAGKSKAQP